MSEGRSEYEQVGWFVRFPSGIEAISLTPFENDTDMGRQEPVYRLRPGAEIGKCPGCDQPLSVNDWCPRCLKFAAEFGSRGGA